MRNRKAITGGLSAGFVLGGWRRLRSWRGVGSPVPVWSRSQPTSCRSL